jgi:hypothetical protein
MIACIECPHSNLHLIQYNHFCWFLWRFYILLLQYIHLYWIFCRLGLLLLQYNHLLCATAAALLFSLLMLPLAAISTSATSLQHPLAAILLLCHWYNLLWRIFYFYAILTTYSGGHPTFCNDASTYIYFSLRLLLSSSLHHPLAAILLLYHHFNLLWRLCYYYIIL